MSGKSSKRGATARRLHADRAGVTAPLGLLLTLGITLSATLAAGGAWNAWMEARTDWANAEADRAELMAWCARNPDVQDDRCPSRGDLPPGTSCRSITGGLWICGNEPDIPIDPTRPA
jgi:hypothetical protein